MIPDTNSTFSVDRFEENFAVCENLETGIFINIPISDLPKGIKEGSIIKFENGKYILDKKLEDIKKQEVKNLVNNLFKKK